MAYASHTQEEIDAVRAQSDLLLALPALLLRPVPRAATAAPRRRSGDAEDAPELHAHPRGANSVSFSATLRRRLQKAVKDEVAELLKEALREREAKGGTGTAEPAVLLELECVYGAPNNWTSLRAHRPGPAATPNYRAMTNKNAC